MLESKSLNSLFSAMVGYKCCFYSSYEYGENMKVTCEVAGSQFADSFCSLGWAAAA